MGKEIDVVCSCLPVRILPNQDNFEGNVTQRHELLHGILVKLTVKQESESDT